ncbi:MAG: hypothetical protein V1720_06860 [bacterium]
MKRIITSALLTIVIILIVAETNNAIPAFARKYKLSCQTCHAPVPRLKAFGDEFAGNGFVLPNQESPRYFENTGDDLLSLIKDFPIAARIDMFTTYNRNDDDRVDWQVPYSVKLLSGGSLAENLSYYFYFYMSERGEIAGVEDAYIMFNNLFDSELDLYVGQFQVSDPLFKREVRLTLEDYELYRQRVGESNINLTYDRGIMMTYGFETGTDLIFEIVNGNGIHAANELRNFDNDKYKNFVGRISQDIGDFIRVGAFCYYGKEDLNTDSTNFANELYYYGPDITLSYEDKAQLNLQYLERVDKNPYVIASPVDIKTKSFLAELILMPEGDNTRLYGAALFNWLKMEDIELYKTATLQVGYLLRRNMRLVGEITYDLKNKYGRMAVGVVSAF